MPSLAKSKDTWNNMPMCECPHCKVDFQKDDYYDVEAGDEWECPTCDKIITVVSVDTITHVRLSVEKEE